jgi:hypothetical protein
MRASDYGEVSWERITAANQKVQRRLLCTVAALEQAAIPCAVAGIIPRDKDRTHVRDLIGVALVDATWVERLPASLRPRLQQLLDTPEG